MKMADITDTMLTSLKTSVLEVEREPIDLQLELEMITEMFMQPEIRRWNCEAFNRGFWGVHLLGGQYNAGGFRVPLLPTLRHTRYQGWMVGGGISYGYHWYLGAHWNLEATVGLGYIYTRYDRFECYRCGRVTGRDEHHGYWGPTRVGISVVYLFNHK